MKSTTLSRDAKIAITLIAVAIIYGACIHFFTDVPLFPLVEECGVTIDC